MAWHGKSLGELVGTSTPNSASFTTAAWIWNCAPDKKSAPSTRYSDAKMKRVLDWRVTRREDLDGIKLYLGDIGWLMLRASGTEPVLRVYAETSNAAVTKRVLDHVCAAVRAI